MSRHSRTKNIKPGLPPGSLIYTGPKRPEPTEISVHLYTQDNLQTEASWKGIQLPIHQNKVWVDVTGLQDTEILRELGNKFDIHSLALEDIVDIYQRPKFDSYETGFLLLMESYDFFPERLHLEQEQISIFCGKNYVLSFQENKKDCFASIKARLQNNQSRNRKNPSDYLAYSLADIIVDRYFVILDEIGDEVEKMELDIASNPNFETKNRIHLMKRVVLDLRKGISPLRDAISLMMHAESPFVSDSTFPYLQDLYGNVLQSMEMVDTYRDILSGLQDLYLAEISYKMNKVIQTLTIVSTIFIPLTFLVGLYGMNFDYMPELHWRYGYFILLGFMAFVTIGLLLLFRRKKWL
jgi:magnesium transporter